MLRPGGVFLFNVWDRIAENEVPQTVEESVATVFPDDPPRFLSRAPYGYHDAGVVERSLRQAGFAQVAVETVAKRGRAPSAREPGLGFCQGSPLRSDIEARDSARLGMATEAATAAVIARFGKGPLDSKIQAHVFSATR